MALSSSHKHLCLSFLFFGIPPLPDASANFYRFTNDFLFSFESRLNVECRHHHHLPRKKGSVKERKKKWEETDGVGGAAGR